MANTKSIQKILNYLQKKSEAVTPSEICIDNALKWKTVKEILEILSQSNQIVLLQNGKTSLVKICNNGTTK